MTQEAPAVAAIGRRRWWRRTLPWGLTVSLLFGLIPLFAASHGVAFLLAFLVVLSGTVVTLLIDPLTRLDGLIDRTTESLTNIQQTLAPLDAPPDLQEFVRAVAGDWRAIESSGAAYLRALLDASRKEAAERIHSIAQGRIELGVSDRNNFRSAPLNMFRRMCGVHAFNLDYWNQPHGKQYLERQRAAIKAGSLTVERIMVVTPEDLKMQNFREGVKRQLDAGVTVLIFNKSEADVPVPLRRFLEDFTIATDQRGAQMLVRPQGSDMESFSCDPGEIDEYQHAFTELSAYSRPATEVFGDLEKVPSP